MFIIYLLAALHIPGSNDSLVIAIKVKLDGQHHVVLRSTKALSTTC
jgi:hypothetical protein